MVRDRMQTSQSRQKAYVDRKRRPLEFAAGDHVFLRVTPEPLVWEGLSTRGSSLLSSLALIRSRGRLGQWLMR